MSNLPNSTLLANSDVDSPPHASPRLLIAASGTGGHVFPAIAVAERLPTYQIEWLGVPNRLETQLVPETYPLHLIDVEGFQSKGWDVLRVLLKFGRSLWQTHQLLQRGQFQAVFTTGGYIAAPATIAARWLGLPVILHESNAIPGKVTRFLSPRCTVVAIGFDAAAKFLPQTHTVCVGTPVRSQFLAAADASTKTDLNDLPIPPDVPLIVVVGGSQGAIGVNKLVRQAALDWIAAGAWIVHLTGETDPDTKTFQHPHYLALPFYSNMAGLLRRATIAISRAGAGTLTELAITETPSILIPYPFAAEDHQTFNAKVFAEAGAALVFQQSDLTPDRLTEHVLSLLQAPDRLATMRQQAARLAVPDSADRLAALIRQQLESETA